MGFTKEQLETFIEKMKTFKINEYCLISEDGIHTVELNGSYSNNMMFGTYDFEISSKCEFYKIMKKYPFQYKQIAEILKKNV